MSSDRNDGQIDRRRSTFSGPGSNCVEVVFDSDGGVTVHDSKTPGPSLTFSSAEWDAFLAGVRNDEFDRPGG